MAPVAQEGPAPRGEADEASRGSAVKLAAEVSSRLLLLFSTVLLIRGLGAADYGLLLGLQVYALLLAELGELGLQPLASRALVAGTISLRAFLRARLALAALAAAAALAAGLLVPPLAARLGAPAVDGPSLALLVLWFALSGWGEFLGVALRCRGRRTHEALVLLLLRAGALAAAALALLAGSGVRGVSALLAASTAPALALAVALLRRTAAPAPPGAAPCAPAASSPDLPPGQVLRESAPLAVHAALLLLGPRVEYLALWWLRGDHEVGLFAAGLSVIWFLGMVPTAATAGAMPALTREALRGEGAVRRRTAATLSLLGAPAAVGLALVAGPVVRLLLGPGYSPGDYAAAGVPLCVMASAVPALFLNSLLAASLIAASRAPWLPRLTALRVGTAAVLAAVLVPPWGGVGAAAGLVTAEWLLLFASALACRRAGFAVPVLRPLLWALAACLPMALAVTGVRESLPLAVPLGALTFAATLAAGLLLLPRARHHLAWP